MKSNLISCLPTLHGKYNANNEDNGIVFEENNDEIIREAKKYKRDGLLP